MKTRAVIPLAVLFVLSYMMIAPALAADPVVADPPNGLSAQALGATRLSDEQNKRVTPVSHAPLAPFYPREARRAGTPGKVVLDLLIDSEGNVKDARVLEESPLGLGFGDAAVAAAQTYKFVNPFGKLVIRKTTLPFAP